MGSVVPDTLSVGSSDEPGVQPSSLSAEKSTANGLWTAELFVLPLGARTKTSQLELEGPSESPATNKQWNGGNWGLTTLVLFPFIIIWRRALIRRLWRNFTPSWVWIEAKMHSCGWMVLIGSPLLAFGVNVFCEGRWQRIGKSGRRLRSATMELSIKCALLS